MAAPGSIGEVSEEVGWMHVHCAGRPNDDGHSWRRCHHRAALPFDALARAIGPDTSFDEVARRLTCTTCRGRSAHFTRPSWDIHQSGEPGWQELPVSDVPLWLHRWMGSTPPQRMGAR